MKFGTWKTHTEFEKRLEDFAEKKRELSMDLTSFSLSLSLLPAREWTMTISPSFSSPGSPTMTDPQSLSLTKASFLKWILLPILQDYKK